MESHSPKNQSHDPRDRAPSSTQKLTTRFAIAIFISALIDLSVLIVFRDLLWALIGCFTLTGILLIGLGYIQRQNLKTRTAAFGLHSTVMVILVLFLLGAINFFTHKHPKKLDLTKEKLNTLSDQSIKTIKGLEKPIKATYFAKEDDQELIKGMLKLYRDVAPDKFEVEYVNPFLDKQSAIQAGIVKTKTLQLKIKGEQGSRDIKVEEPTEEKITNAIIKITKTKNILVCSSSGHEELSLENQAPEGYSTIKNALTGQNYQTKTVTIAQVGKVPSECNVLLISGARTNFIQTEIKALSEYLEQGGALLVSLSIGEKGKETAPELNAFLKSWGVTIDSGIVIDTQFALRPSPEFPGVNQYDLSHPITKGTPANTFHPVVRPVSALTTPIAGIKVTEIAKTAMTSYLETNLTSTEPTRFDAGKDKKGPISIAVAVEGKKAGSKASKSNRIVVFGSSLFVANQFAPLLSANVDLFLNALAWTAEDDSAISIRAKENGPGNVIYSPRMARVVALVTVALIPILFASFGVFIWFMRRRL